MRRLLLVFFSLLFIFTCSKDGVDQIKVNIPEGITVPEGMVYIPVGDFIMGHPGDSETEKGKVVTLAAFFIDRFEVSREQFSTFNPDYRFHPKKARFPVSMVTFEQARGYCKWNGRRLPTEAEWEKSARGPDGRKWPWRIYYEHPKIGRAHV